MYIILAIERTIQCCQFCTLGTQSPLNDRLIFVVISRNIDESAWAEQNVVHIIGSLGSSKFINPMIIVFEYFYMFIFCFQKILKSKNQNNLKLLNEQKNIEQQC